MRKLREAGERKVHPLEPLRLIRCMCLTLKMDRSTGPGDFPLCARIRFSQSLLFALNEHSDKWTN